MGELPDCDVGVGPGALEVGLLLNCDVGVGADVGPVAAPHPTSSTAIDADIKNGSAE